MKPKLLFINNMAAPYQVKFCYALQKYFDAEMWFYTHLEANRPKWWALPLGDKCRVLEGSTFHPIFNYSNPNLLEFVKEYNPDIVIAGGFFLPSQWNVKKWCKSNNKTYITLGERVSYKGYNPLSKALKKIIKRVFAFLYRDIDLFLAMGEKPMEQAINELGFSAEKVILARYPQDIDVNLTHPLRKTTDSPILIFPNRLDKSYNPLFALEVFSEFLKKYPNSILKMNEMGELKNDCLTYIERNDLSNNVVFLEGISSWDDLPTIYAEAHVALFTATDSNGPNSLIECMASGIGVVLSNLIYNTDEYCKHEINCFKHDLHVSDFVSALIKYVEEEGLIEQHGSISKNLLRERSVSNTAKFYAEVIRDNTKHHINIDS